MKKQKTKNVLMISIVSVILVFINITFQEINSGNNKLFYFNSLFDNTYNKVISSIDNNNYPISIINVKEQQNLISISDFRQKNNIVNSIHYILKISIFIFLIIVTILMLYYFYNISKAIFLNESSTNNMIKYIRIEAFLLFIFALLHPIYFGISTTIARSLIIFPNGVFVNSIRISPFTFLCAILLFLFSTILSDSKC